MKMEKDQTKFCRFCLTIISNRNFKQIDDIVRQVIDVLLLKLNVEENHEPVMCNACSLKLFAAFNFKAICIDTEDSIFPYVDSEKVVPIDLREVYLKIKGKEHLSSMLEDEKICRLCMQFITRGATLIEEIQIDVIHRYIPEVNFKSTKKPVICSPCLDSLNIHSSFLKNCSDAQEKNKNVDDSVKGDPFHIVSEKIELKTEEYDEYGDTCLQGDELVDSEKMDRDSPNVCKSKRKNSLKLQTYKCKRCNFKTKSQSILLRHQLTHKNFSEVTVYKCDNCDFKTKYKCSFKNHQLLHKDFSEVQVYKCDTCDYRTKYKGYLVKHELQHKNFSEIKLYKCDACDFKTKHKNALINHQLKHKDFSEVPVYKCDVCNFKTKYKRSLINHGVKHNSSEIGVYKCDQCNYRTKVKIAFKNHQMRHKDISEVQVYKCDKCVFKTKYKSNFKNHQLLHKDFSEVQVYKCDTCEYITKHKGYLVKHERQHRKFSEIKF